VVDNESQQQKGELGMGTRIRRLVDGTSVPDRDDAVNLCIKTRALGKWLLVDLEKTHVFLGTEKTWAKVSPERAKTLLALLWRKK
jgi:hypothetical protein